MNQPSALHDPDGELHILAARVIAENTAAERSIALAESCTGGLVAAALTDISGSSSAFVAGFVTYANAAKIQLVGVPSEIIEQFGAVSQQTVQHMAHGAALRGDADVAVAISGVAGPLGGSAEKPVGTVYFARALRGKPAADAQYWLCQFDSDGGRSFIRLQATLFALKLLLP